MASKSILNKLADVTLEDKTFTNTETGEVIEYKRVVLSIVVDGVEESIECVPAKAEGKAAYKVLALADNLDQ